MKPTIAVGGYERLFIDVGATGDILIIISVDTLSMSVVTDVLERTGMDTFTVVTSRLKIISKIFNKYDNKNNENNG